MTNEIRSIIKLILASVITAFAVAGVIFAFTFESKMEEVRDQTIEEAVLVSSNENGYVLSFNGELHSYSFS